jgi:hypothetical protein
VDQIKEVLSLAGAALKHLPAERIHPKLTHWPDYTRAVAESYGYADGDPYNLYHRNRVIRSRGASREESTALDTLLEWWPWLTQEQFQVLCARHMGLSWRAVSRIRRKRKERPNSHEACRQLYRGAIGVIYGRLNGGI